MDGEANRLGFEAFDGVKGAIVVCAHADDLETMMGGTAWLLAQMGVEIRELICTRGDLGTSDAQTSREALASTRREEATTGAKMLGLKEVVTLDYPDGELEPTLDLRAEIARYFRLWQPDTLFTFDPNWPGQIHPDHRAAGRAALDAFMPSKMPLYRPEQLKETSVATISRAFLFSPAVPTVTVDVSEVYNQKIAASMAHNSQFPDGEKSLEWMRELDRSAAKKGGVEGEYAEQFAMLRLW